MHPIPTPQDGLAVSITVILVAKYWIQLWFLLCMFNTWNRWKSLTRCKTSTTGECRAPGPSTWTTGASTPTRWNSWLVTRIFYCHQTNWGANFAFLKLSFWKWLQMSEMQDMMPIGTCATSCQAPWLGRFLKVDCCLSSLSVGQPDWVQNSAAITVDAAWQLAAARETHFVHCLHPFGGDCTVSAVF